MSFGRFSFLKKIIKKTCKNNNHVRQEQKKKGDGEERKEIGEKNKKIGKKQLGAMETEAESRDGKEELRSAIVTSLALTTVVPQTAPGFQ
jgi:hypothetical protein